MALAATSKEAATNLDGDFSSIGPHSFEVRREDWFDADRERLLPVKLYLPETDAKSPVVIFSHGLGGNRDAAGYLGRHWASWGITGIFIQHPGSDESVWAGKKGREVLEALAEAARDPEAALNRFRDVPFIINELERHEASGTLNIDASRIGMSGHSYGAHTTLALLGRAYDVLGVETFVSDQRIDGGVLLSPPPITTRDEVELDKMFHAISTPMFHFTGTKDAVPLGLAGKPIDRRVPFDAINASPQYLVIYEGGDHAAFGGRERVRGRLAPDWYKDIQAMTSTASTAFWFSILLDDQNATRWLAGPGLETSVREDDQVERK